MSNGSNENAGSPSLPADVLTVTSLDTLKVLADPHRMRIIETVGEDRLTVKQIAERLGEGVHKLYYHVRQLEEHGLMVEVDSRVVSGIVEKTYALAAKRFEVAKDLLGAGAEGEDAFISTIRSLMEGTVEGASRAVREGLVSIEEDTDSTVVFSRAVARMAGSNASAFVRRLEALVDEYFASTPGDEGHPYGLTVVFHELVDREEHDV